MCPTAWFTATSGFPVDEGEGPRGDRSHPEAGTQAGPHRVGDGVEVVDVAPALALPLERLVHDPDGDGEVVLGGLGGMYPAALGRHVDVLRVRQDPSFSVTTEAEKVWAVLSMPRTFRLPRILGSSERFRPRET